MKVKHFDPILKEWVIDGASNASNLELTNPGFLTDQGESISIDEAFTKVDNKLNKLEQNLAWVYKNGAIGGGGGGGGTGTEYTITIHNEDPIYTSSTSTEINFTINSGGIKKIFTVEIKDDTGRVVLTTKVRSMEISTVTLTGLSGSKTYSIQGYDATDQYTNQAFIKIITGAISVDFNKNSVPLTISLSGVNEVPLIFTVNKNLENDAKFTLTCNNQIVALYEKITTASRVIREDARKILFKDGIFNPTVGQKFIFTAQAEILMNDVLLKSSLITFSITVADSNTLIIVTENISDYTEGMVYENITSFSQGTTLAFPYYFSYGNTKYKTFNMTYSVHLMNGSNEVKLLKSGEVTNIDKTNTNLIFTLSTVDLDVNVDPEFLKITLFGYAVDAPTDTSAQYTKRLAAKITERTYVDLYANNDMHTLLAYFSPVTGFPDTPTGTWNYKFPTTGQFAYDGAFNQVFKDGVNFTLNKVNGSTNGFITVDSLNKIRAIRLNGESYGELEVADKMFPNIDISQGSSFFQQGGFHLSITYKPDLSSDGDETILSIAKYNEDGSINTGYQITLDYVTCKIGTADILSCKLPKNEIITIDLDVSYTTNIGWYFKIYINGVLSAVTKVDTSDIDWTFGENIYFNCKNTNGVLSNYSNVTIYDFKVYTTSQSEFSIVQNYISALEQASLIQGNVDKNLDIILRTKNLFDSEGNCIIWDKSKNSGKGDFLEGDELYDKLITQMKESMTPYPVVLIEETSLSPTLFEIYTQAVFSSADKESIMDQTFPCKITYTDTNNRSVLIRTPTENNVSSDKGVRIGLQGTSSLSYNSKNFELYMGNMNEAGTPLLFQVKDEWLPENEFTLKADVMDSAHVNNVVIGEIINGLVKGVDGNIFKPFDQTPPMTIGNDVWGGDVETATYMKSRMKHTSEGFPCLVFIKFAPDLDGNTKAKKFMGIYNFNLGRYAYYNLGLKLLLNYEKINTEGPTLVSSYNEKNNHWNTGNSSGVYSMEINQNSSSQGAFQQDDLSIVKFMSDPQYSSRDDEIAWTNVQKFYSQMAKMALNDTQKYTMDDANLTPTKPIPGEFYKYDSSVYKFSQADQYLNWNNAVAYHIIAIVFGLVDSMCKNLTLRNWGVNSETGIGAWYTCFYDMDTAFGLNNSGQDIVAYWAHLHRWYNKIEPSSGLTIYDIQRNYNTDSLLGIQQYYASYWNRIWEVLENLALRDSGGVADRESLESMYLKFRTNLFPDPDAFIDTYYKAYTEKTGSIMFNYDYRIKYLKIVQTYNESTGQLEDTTDFTQLKFLHGNRVIHVKDWFKKRIYFLDGVYSKGDTLSIPANIESPINSAWSNNKASALDSKFGTTVTGSSKMLHKYGKDKTTIGFWIDETDQTAIVAPPTGETILYFYANKYITKYDKFKNFPWTDLATIDLPLLKELDLSYLKTVPASNFFVGGVYNPGANNGKGVGLKNIENLNLSNVQLTSGASAYNLNVSNCNKLQILNISSSNITNVTLPSSATLKEYNLSNTDITKLELSNQSFLEILNISNCNKLTSIKLTNCSNIKALDIPKSVQTIEISNCENFELISLSYTSVNNSISPLTSLIIDNCPGLKTVNVDGQNNPNLIISLTGARNLETLNISNIKTQNITLPSVKSLPFFSSLKSLNISKTDFTYLKYNDYTPDHLDLSFFPDLDNIIATDNTNLVKVTCKNDSENPIYLQTSAFSGCSSLTNIVGHYNVNGSEIFKGCSSLVLNLDSTYQEFGVTNFLEGSSFTNISFSNTNSSVISVFENCYKLSSNDFKYLLLRLNNNITSTEKLFKNCTSINADTRYDMLRNVPKLTNMKEMFSGTSITGIFYSRSSNYSISDDSTWGLLDFVPALIDADSAFSGTKLEWIDNNALAYCVNIKNVNNIFSNCTNLKSCANTRVSVIVESNLQSETFFINLKVVDIYPKNVFMGCSKIKMTINEDSNGNTLLFHLKNNYDQPMVLPNTLYAGVDLVGEIKVNVFGGITNSVKNGEYFIPKFNNITNPFVNACFNKLATIDLSKMGDIFKNMSSILTQAVNVFNNLTLIGTKSIPANIFKSCIKLTSIEGIFSNLEIDNGGAVYSFPPQGMFDDCISLRIIKNLFYNTNKVKIKLVGEGFKNCQLTDVSYAFSNSGIIETIPYRLFFMSYVDPETSQNIVRNSIVDMSNVFSGCYLLGYDQNRSLNIGQILTSGKMLTWLDHVVLKEGNPVYYSLDFSSRVKTQNYNNYVNDVNLDYDYWYLDGTSNTVIPTSDPSYAEFYAKFLEPDIKQKQVIDNPDTSNFYKNEVLQNYAIPTDLFRYCTADASITDVLSKLTWFKNKITSDGSAIETINVIEGLKGRIPMKLLSIFVKRTDFNSLFKDTHFEPFVGYNSNGQVRGYLYPKDLFENNIELLELTSCFEQTNLIVGVDINSDLFKNNTKLQIINNLWANCNFDNRRYNDSGTGTAPIDQSQINFTEIFKYNIKINSASGLFQISNLSLGKTGLLIITSDLLKLSNNIMNIEGMFMNCSLLKGAVPPFEASNYLYLTKVDNYLKGVPKSNITNADSLETRLRPAEWLS